MNYFKIQYSTPLSNFDDAGVFTTNGGVQLYNGQHVVIKDVDKSNNICSIALPSSPTEIYQTGIPLNHIIHSISGKNMSNTKVKVVYGKLQGEIGSLIGIDNEETKYLINVFFENSPLMLRKIEVFINHEFLQISIFDHNYNEDFDKSFFKLISPKLTN